MVGGSRTVGVEEELLLVNSQDGRLASAAVALVEDPQAGGRLRYEFKREQVEIATPPCRSMAELSTAVEECRRQAVAVAAKHDVLLCACGTSPSQQRPTAVATPRFGRISDEFAAMAADQLTCGMHVHVSVESPSEGIGVLDRIRVWLAPLIALSANSPFWRGEDSGYASYRSVVISELPTAGPAPIWGDPAAYGRCVQQCLATGAAFDPGMIYFEARLSATYPTVEIRVMDVCPRSSDVVALAAVCRALVDTAAGEWRAGVTVPEAGAPVLRSAAWRAARYGFDDQLFSPVTERLEPGWDVVTALIAHIGDALVRNGDWERVTDALATIRTHGTGVRIQRSAAEGGHPLADVVRSTALGTTL